MKLLPPGSYLTQYKDIYHVKKLYIDNYKTNYRDSIVYYDHAYARYFNFSLKKDISFNLPIYIDGVEKRYSFLDLCNMCFITLIDTKLSTILNDIKI